MNHQSDKTGMYVENPLELQMLFGEKLFLDEKDALDVKILDEESVDVKQEVVVEKPLPIVFFVAPEDTRQAGVAAPEILLGKMLSVTMFEGAVPTMKDAEIKDLTAVSEDDFKQKVKIHRKIVVFTDKWPFGEDVGNGFQLLKIETTLIFIAPSITTIMGNLEIKKDFAARLKHYFAND